MILYFKKKWLNFPKNFSLEKYFFLFKTIEMTDAGYKISSSSFLQLDFHYIELIILRIHDIFNIHDSVSVF